MIGPLIRSTDASPPAWGEETAGSGHFFIFCTAPRTSRYEPMEKSLSALRNDILQERFDTYFITVEHAGIDVEVRPAVLFDTISTLAEHEGPDHRLDVVVGSLGSVDTLTVTDFKAS